MKKIIALVVVLLVIAASVFYIPKYVDIKGEEKVKFNNLESENIPVQISEVLPNYRLKEKALVCKVNSEIFVVVTRGEKKSSGYEVKIKKIELVKEKSESVLNIYAEYKDPKPGEITTQIMTYPYIVVETNLEKLPDKVKLEKEYIH